MFVSEIRIPEDVLRFFRKTGAQGGKARAKRHTKEELSAWGKMGGRPKKLKAEPTLRPKGGA